MNSITPADYAASELGEHLLLDVRQPEEWASVHIEGATLIPLGELVARLDELPADLPLYVMCHAGGRSAQATAYLEQAGYDATNIEGGITAWIESGLPVQHGA